MTLRAPEELGGGQRVDFTLGDAVVESDEVKALVDELRQLRRGLGLHAADVLGRVGPILTRVCGLDSLPAPGERRERLSQRIGGLVSALPTELRLAVQAAFGLPPADQSRFLRKRMEWLGDQLDRDPRTALRRVEAGLTLLAEGMLQTAVQSGDDVYAPGGWFVESFRATLMMHVDPVELIETRRVVSTIDGLDRITVAWSIPAVHPGSRSGLRVDLLYGGELERDEKISTETFWSCTVKIPQPLRRGESHEFQVRVVSLPRSDFQPYFVVTPFRRCDEFVLRAKFDGSGGEPVVWALDGTPFQLVHENHPLGEQLSLDSVGEVEQRFQDLRTGLSYGLRWRFDEPGPGR
jgi:hypothetical protein